MPSTSHTRGRKSSTRRRARFALLLVVALGALSAAFAPAASAASYDGVFGVNPGDVFKLPQSQWDAHLSAMAADGIQVVRMGAWWSDLEPGPPTNGQHHYSFSELDVKVAALARHGLRWDPLICFTPTWDSKIDGDYSGAPKSNEDFGLFAAALARRYGPNGSFWAEHPEVPALPVNTYEVWNEQNAPVYWHPGDAGTYADLYAAGRSAIHSVDDGARVVVGGLAATIGGVTPAGDFVRQMLAHRPDLRGRLDAVAFHPYAADVAGVQANVARFRRELDAAAGPGIPMEITEIGWSTTNTSESARAADLAEVASTLPRSDCGIDRLMAYAWVGPEQNAADREQWFGIVRADASPKPAATAFAAAVRQMRGLAGAPPAGTVAICNTGGRAASDATRSASAPPASSAAAPRSASRHKRARLRVRVRQNRRHPDRLRVVARCPGGCRLRVELLRAPRASAASLRFRVAKRRVARITRHRRAVSLKVGSHAYGKRVRVRVVARSRGHRIRRVRSVRMRWPSGPHGRLS